MHIEARCPSSHLARHSQRSIVPVHTTRCQAVDCLASFQARYLELVDCLTSSQARHLELVDCLTSSQTRHVELGAASHKLDHPSLYTPSRAFPFDDDQQHIKSKISMLYCSCEQEGSPGGGTPRSDGAPPGFGPVPGGGLNSVFAEPGGYPRVNVESPCGARGGSPAGGVAPGASRAACTTLSERLSHCNIGINELFSYSPSII